MGEFIAIIICVVIIVISLRLLPSLIRADKKTKAKKIQKEIRKKIKFTHITGLPLASDVKGEFSYNGDKITFKKDFQEIVLECNDIIDIDIVSDKDIYNQINAINTGAITAKTVYGWSRTAISVLSLMQLSSIANKTNIAITYKNSEEMKFILLSIELSKMLASELIKDFRTNTNRQPTYIKL